MTAEEAVSRHKEEIEDTGSLIDHIVDGAVGRALGQAEVGTVFGEPTTHGDCVVIPVGRVQSRYGFGGGSGEGASAGPAGDTGAGGGGGGGGMLEVKPIGYIEITSGSSRFMPITDGSAIAIRAVTMGGIAAIVFILGLFRVLRARQ